MPEPILLPTFITLTIGMAVYFLGAHLTRAVRFLRDYNIPEPVSGGLAVAAAVWALRAWADAEISFDLAMRDTLLVIFFATIGLNARFADLVRGGRPLAILLALTLAFMVLQNVVALLGFGFFDMPQAGAVMVGSAALIGGHGTAIAWGPTIETQFSVPGAAEIGIAAATLGLVMASLIGGPIASFLIKRHDLTARDPYADTTVGLAFAHEESHPIEYVGFMRTLLTINIAIIIGYGINLALAANGLKLPLFVPCLIVGILIANLQPLLAPNLPVATGTPVLALISEFSLSVFLAMSLMSMQLWTLAGMAGPLFAIIGVQTAMTAAFCIFVLFPAMGGNYRAAVLGAGFGGFALGATPTAIANMTAVTKRYGPSPVAFIILPLVSAFFVDLANAFVIQVFVGF